MIWNSRRRFTGNNVVFSCPGVNGVGCILLILLSSDSELARGFRCFALSRDRIAYSRQPIVWYLLEKLVWPDEKQACCTFPSLNLAMLSWIERELQSIVTTAS
jgi:hypothetical protein